MDQRTKLSEQMQGLMDSPADLVGQLARENTEWLIQLQKSFMSSMNPARTDPQDD